MADKIVKIYGDARFLPRHDTLENWQRKNPILLEAEPSYVIDGEDGKKIKFGDGVTPWNGLPYLSSNINNGGDITVDQSYNPDSENAQSGKAVAEAAAIEHKRANNTFANALKSSKSGSAILIDDISPVTHEMSVKISSDTVTDLTAVKVTRYGKNLIQTNIIEVTSPAGVENLIWQGHISGKLSFSLDISEYTPKPSTATSANFKFVFGDGTVKYLGASGPHIYLNTSSPLKEIYFLNWGEGTGVLKNIQLEIGSPETDYEPYAEPTYYTPNADGTVNGVTSLYPNTTLMTDTEGVIIDCEYNKDINTFSGADVDVPTKTSELINDSNFATQDYVDEEIANFDFIKIVTELPETGLVNRTYFVPKQDPATNDLYDEYMWVDGKTVIDQTYDKNSQNAQSGIAVAEALSGYVMEELNQAKQEILNSLNYDIFGTVNEDNNIIINAALADGTYILKYENQDGTLTEIGTLAVGEETPEPETPITPTSNLFVADTCVLNMRINSSGTLKEQNYTFVTDYIDIGNVMVGGGENKIHFSNFWIYKMTAADINASGSGGVHNVSSCYRGINYYDKDNNFLGQDTGYYAEPAITDENGDYVITLDATKTDARYIRVCGTLNVALTDTSQLINCEIRLNELIP